MHTCADCTIGSCDKGTAEGAPQNCPSREWSAEQNAALYSDEEKKMARASALVEAEGYCKNSRLEEIMDYAYKLGFKKLGVAFCTGFHAEAATLVKILRANGFEVESVCCKNGCVPKAAIGVAREEQVHPENEMEPMCNPAAQARHLVDARCDLAIILGLCVGHDTLFIRHCSIPVTVFAAKDRALGHNPLAAIYTSGSYMSRVYTFIERKYGK